MTELFTLKGIEQKLQKAGRKQARLYLFSNFIALMIISAYAALMMSQTVQKAFPEGGDSRKQMYMIFVLTLAGCVVFTVYAAGLFFRYKSRQIGVLMALGASRKRLLPGLMREVLLLSSLSAVAGALAGIPFVWLLWGLFRLILVDSSQMVLALDARCLLVSAAFFLLVVGVACLSAWRYLQKTNIMEVIREEHLNEPVKEPGRWCGYIGAALVLGGAVLGYSAPRLWEIWFHRYSPFWIGVFYLPVFPGLYMVMLHTVVYGWKSRKKHPYENTITRGMVKLQAKQTVNNLLIITLLIAGASFAIFYIPAGSISSLLEYKSAPYDYFYHYRLDQDVFGKEDVSKLAQQYGLSVKDWKEGEYINLAAGGILEAEDENHRLYTEYAVLKNEVRVLSEDTYHALTGQNEDVAPGTYLCLTNEKETNLFVIHTAKDLTNIVTGAHIETSFAGYAHYGLLTGIMGWIVLDNADYAVMEQGLTDEWKGRIVQFNAHEEDSYAFAGRLYDLFVDSFDKSCEHVEYYDRVEKLNAMQKGEEYWMESTELETMIRYDRRDTLEFKTSWMYHPKFRILLINEHLLIMGVLYMMFLFIFIVCLTTALIIGFTRCQTIALNNRYLFEDLRKLGASSAFLSKEVRSQCSQVFRMPAWVGMGTMYLLFIGILYANDGKITSYEGIAMLVCLGILVLTGGVVYAVYQRTVKMVREQLDI